MCRGENPPGMKFCRACGTGLAGVAPGVPGIGGGAQNMGYGQSAPMGAPPPMMPPPMGPPGVAGHGGPPMGGAPGMGGMSPGGTPGMGGGMSPMGGAPGMGGGMNPPPSGPPMGGAPGMGGGMHSPMGPAGMHSPMGGAPGMGGGMGAPMSGPPGGNSPMFAATMAQDGPGPGGGGLPPMSAGGTKPGAASSAGASGMINCPRCGTPTPVGFAYCQQCGLHMSALQPTDPGANARERAPSSPASGPPSFGGSGSRPSSPAIGPANVDGHAMTLATDGPRPSPVSSPAIRPAPQAGPTWGTAVLVNRDGSDGQRFSLTGEYCVVGRAGADIAFDDDRFLARQHARFERAVDGSVRVEALDALNGVFRKADLPIDLVDGTVVLVGREVLRYEKVDPEEVKVHPLVRHGVALFGSPPREPWGRFVQIIPSGGYRDVRHLAGEEIVLGREEGDIVFRDDAFMSRRHAAVTWDGRKAQITDLGSSNGTFVRITQPTPIKNGDHVRMGDQLLRIELGK